MSYFPFTLPSTSFHILYLLLSLSQFSDIFSICKNAGRNIYENLFFLHSSIKSEMFIVNFVLMLYELSVKHGLIVSMLYRTVIS